MWQSTFIQLFIDTIYAPRQAAKQLLSLRFDDRDILTSLALASVLGAMMNVLTRLLFPVAASPLTIIPSPILLAAFMFVVALMGAAMLIWTGRFLGGTGQFNDALRVVTWLQFMSVAVQLAGFVVTLLLPGLAAILFIVANFYGLWIFLNFIKVAQDFEGVGKALANMMAAFICFTLLLSFFFSAIGLGITE